MGLAATAADGWRLQEPHRHPLLCKMGRDPLVAMYLSLCTEPYKSYDSSLRISELRAKASRQAMLRPILICRWVERRAPEARKVSVPHAEMAIDQAG